MSDRINYSALTGFVVMKSWYSPRFGPYSVHHSKVVRLYTYKPDADAVVESLNKECTMCPRRTAQKTKYWVDDRLLSIRVRNHQ